MYEEKECCMRRQEARDRQRERDRERERIVKGKVRETERKK